MSAERRWAIVLGGGRSERMGTDKLALEIEGRSLVQRVCEAAGAVSAGVVFAGAHCPVPHVVCAGEDPPFGGPAAGIAAALARVPADAEEVLLLAGDLAWPEHTVAALMAAEPVGDGVILEDPAGQAQTLAGRYRAQALRRAVAAQPSVRNVSVRRLLGGLTLTAVGASAQATADLDTPDDARRAGARISPQ